MQGKKNAFKLTCSFTITCVLVAELFGNAAFLFPASRLYMAAHVELRRKRQHGSDLLAALPFLGYVILWCVILPTKFDPNKYICLLRMHWHSVVPGIRCCLWLYIVTPLEGTASQGKEMFMLTHVSRVKPAVERDSLSAGNLYFPGMEIIFSASRYLTLHPSVSYLGLPEWKKKNPHFWLGQVSVAAGTHIEKWKGPS